MEFPFTPGVSPPENPAKMPYWFIFSGNRLLYHVDQTEIIPRLPDLSALALEVVQQHFLGHLWERPCFAVDVAEATVAPEGMAFAGLRELFEPLGDELFMVAGRAVQVVDWERTHQFCGRCGAKTENHRVDRAKVCPQCLLSNYPRLSPSIIVRVRRGDEILLARSSRWTTKMFSVIAGFVEPGETLEQAVEREVMEEVGLRVKNIRYFGSQPWPFPNSLMLGFTAEHADREITIDPLEIAEANWFTADNLPPIPSKISIARRLIDDFLASV